jgi:hypothetical protein
VDANGAGGKPESVVRLLVRGQNSSYGLALFITLTLLLCVHKTELALFT